MIRTTVALFVFAVLVCGLIVFRPFSGGDDVARDRLGNPIETGVDVTRVGTPDAGALALAAVSAATDPAGAAANTTRLNTDDIDLTDMTNNVLAELGFSGIQPVTTDRQIQRQSTSDILAGIEAATGRRAALEETDTLESIVIAALRANETDEAIDARINAAAAAGAVAVPDVLVTADGRVDTAVMLQNIIIQAQIASGGAAPAIPNVTPANTAGMEILTEQGDSGAVQVRYYTVQDGDSLGSISVKFYGIVSGFDNIYEANEALLSSPNLIRAGQRLVIPQLDDA